MLSKIDTRLKFIFLLSFSGVIYVHNYIILVIELVFLLFLYYWSKSNFTNFKIYFKLTTYTCVLVYLVIILINFLNNKPLLLKSESILKILIISYSSIIFFATTSFADLFLILRFLRINKSLSEAFFSAFRFFPIVTRELNNIVLAQKSKGLNTKRGYRGIKSIPTVIIFSIIPLLNILIDKIESIYIIREFREIDINNAYISSVFKFSIYNISCFLLILALILFPIFF